MVKLPVTQRNPLIQQYGLDLLSKFLDIVHSDVYYKQCAPFSKDHRHPMVYHKSILMS